MSSIERSNPGREVVRENLDEIPTYYINSTQSQLSFHDLMFELGQVRRATPELVRVALMVRLLMSPQHAKAVAALLARNIAEYERRFGPIPTPPALDEDDSTSQPSANEPEPPS